MKKNNQNKIIEKQLLEAIFQTAADCIIIINSEGIITRINPAGEKLFGFLPDILIGNKVNDLMPDFHRDRHDLYIQDYEVSGEKKVIGMGRDVIAKKKNGELFPCRLSVSEFFILEERCYAGILHDLTQRKQQEKKILDLNKQLEEKIQIKSNDLSEVVSQLLQTNRDLEKEITERKKIEKALRASELEIRKALEKEKELSDLKSNFVTMASHEFRTPLSTILSSASLIEKYNQNGAINKTEKHFNRIKASVKHLTETLNDFLSLTKLEDGKISLSPTLFSLHDFCEKFIADDNFLLKPGQSLNKKIAKENIELFLDRKLLEQIIFNLFSNAIKYSGEGKSIFCNIKTTDNQLTITIQDQGIGIPMNEQKHLFSRFYRGSNAVNIKGTGLGLSIVKEYLQLMNGKITFESKEGIGTTFTINIPIN